MSDTSTRRGPDDVSPDGQRFLLLKDARTPDGQKPAAPESISPNTGPRR